MKNKVAQRITCPTATPLQTLHGLSESELRASAFRNRRPPLTLRMAERNSNSVVLIIITTFQTSNACFYLTIFYFTIAIASSDKDTAWRSVKKVKARCRGLR